MTIYTRSKAIPDSGDKRENERSLRSLRFLHGAISSEEYLKELNQEVNEQLHFRQLAAEFNEAKKKKKEVKRHKGFHFF